MHSVSHYYSQWKPGENASEYDATCKYCAKAQESCGSFLAGVDDAVPLVTRMAHPVVSIVGHSGEEGTALEKT